LLWRHVAYRAQYSARVALDGLREHLAICDVFRTDQLGQTKIEDLYPSVICYKDVFRLEIPVDDPFIVGCGVSTGDLLSIVDRLQVGCMT